MKKLYFGDCLDVLKDFSSKYPNGFIDLIYIDPPFNSKRDYNILFENIDMEDTKAQREAFADTWSNVNYLDSLNKLAELNYDLYEFLKTLDRINVPKSTVSYITTMAIRIHYMHRVLKETGSFYLHCDPNMSHYLKIVCDLIFGRENFRNEVVWHYRRWTNIQKQYQRMHDIILFYTKSKKYKFNRLEIQMTESQLNKFERGWDSNVIDTGIEKYSQLIVYNKNKLKEAIEKGRVDLKRFKKIVYRDKPNVAMSDVIVLPTLNSQSKERLGYPTQKPEALLEKIILASSDEGDVVADFFCGCGTTIAVANRLNRNWIGVDISHLAFRLILKRLTDPYDEEAKKAILSEIEIHGFPRDIASAKELATKGTKGRLEFQYWVVEILLGGIINPKKSADGGWDGYISFWKSDKEKGKVLIEVKSGNANINMLRSFIQVVDRKNADIGLFVCFADYVTETMRLEAKRAGKYDGYNLDKIQIITIEDLLEGKGFKLPGGAEPAIFKKATKDIRPINNNNHLFDE